VQKWVKKRLVFLPNQRRKALPSVDQKQKERGARERSVRKFQMETWERSPEVRQLWS